MRWPERREQQPERSPEIPGREEDGDVRAMKVIGAFRAVDRRDLPADADLSRLEEDGMVQRKTAYLKRGKERAEVYVLTPEAREMLEALQPSEDAQRYWSGLVKPAELEHDLAIYQAYREHAASIEKKGGRVVRVVLDYEFKSAINRELNKRGPEPRSARRARLAEEHDLPVINDRMVYPDVRIEYQDANGREAHLDVEVMTRHYRGQHRATKRQSGFRLVSSNSPRAAVRDDHHLGFL